MQHIFLYNDISMNITIFNVPTGYLSNSTLDLNEEEPKCIGKSAHLSYISIIYVIGVVSNIVLLYADYKEWKKSKTPDKVLISNIAISNIIMLLVGVPLRIVFVSRYRDLVMCYGDVHKLRGVELALWFLCNFVTLAVFCLIGFDRHEALTKFVHERTLTVKKAILSLIFFWTLAFSLGIGFFFTYPKQCIVINSKSSNQRQPYRLVKIGIGLTWAIVCLQRCAHYLLLASKTIREQRQQINDMFGQRQASSEILFTKSVIALLLCYLFSFIPFSISAALFSFNQGSVRWNCAAVWTSTNTYLSFALIPVIYFAIDKRLVRNLTNREAIVGIQNVAISSNSKISYTPKA